MDRAELETILARGREQVFRCIAPTQGKTHQPTGWCAHSNFPESRYATDFIAPEGTPVIAVEDGTVIVAKYDSSRAITDLDEIEKMTPENRQRLGLEITNMVGIIHDNGVGTEYLHLNNVAYVKQGQRVKKGDIIGQVGMTGFTTTPHLHFNQVIVRDGKAVSIPVQFDA